MHRNQFINELNCYLESEFCKDSLDRENGEKILAFVKENQECFNRSLVTGHVTGSAWIIDSNKTCALLTHHAKLEKWLQLGGHADGVNNILLVAKKEGEEESGLSKIRALRNIPFDLDIHRIPQFKNIPAHFHFDARYLFMADKSEPLKRNHESKELAWVPFENIKNYTSEQSVLRLVQKTRLF